MARLEPELSTETQLFKFEEIWNWVIFLGVETWYVKSLKRKGLKKQLGRREKCFAMARLQPDRSTETQLFKLDETWSCFSSDMVCEKLEKSFKKQMGGWEKCLLWRKGCNHVAKLIWASKRRPQAGASLGDP